MSGEAGSGSVPDTIPEAGAGDPELVDDVVDGDPVSVAPAIPHGTISNASKSTRACTRKLHLNIGLSPSARCALRGD